MVKDHELLEAAKLGKVDAVVKILSHRRSGPFASLRRGPGANIQDSCGYTPLHYAALNGHVDIVELLLAADASPSMLDQNGSTPLHLAAWQGNVDVVRCLLAQWRSINVDLATKNKGTALHCAAWSGHTEVVSQLLTHGADPLLKNNDGETPLDLAAQYGRLDTVRHLLKMRPDLVDQYRSPAALGRTFTDTPLHRASRNGHEQVVALLLVAGVGVNIRTNSSNQSFGTALHDAALRGKVAVVQTLLEHRANVDIVNTKNQTVLQLLEPFRSQVHQSIKSLLLRYRQSSGYSSGCYESDFDDDYPPIPVDHSPLYDNRMAGDRRSSSDLETMKQSPNINPPDASAPTVTKTGFAFKMFNVFKLKNKSKSLENILDADMADMSEVPATSSESVIDTVSASDEEEAGPVYMNGPDIYGNPHEATLSPLSTPINRRKNNFLEHSHTFPKLLEKNQLFRERKQTLDQYILLKPDEHTTQITINTENSAQYISLKRDMDSNLKIQQTQNIEAFFAKESEDKKIEYPACKLKPPVPPVKPSKKRNSPHIKITKESPTENSDCDGYVTMNPDPLLQHLYDIRRSCSDSNVLFHDRGAPGCKYEEENEYLYVLVEPGDNGPFEKVRCDSRTTCFCNRNNSYNRKNRSINDEYCTVEDNFSTAPGTHSNDIYVEMARIPCSPVTSDSELLVYDSGMRPNASSDSTLSQINVENSLNVTERLFGRYKHDRTDCSPNLKSRGQEFERNDSICENAFVGDGKKLHLF